MRAQLVIALVVFAVVAATGCPKIRCLDDDHCPTANTCVDGLCVPLAGAEGEGGREGEGQGGEGEGEGQGGEGEGEGAFDDRICQFSCADDADCTTPGLDKCDTANGVCTSAACTTDDACTANFSGWTSSPCSADADCFGATGVCVDLDGAGPGALGGCGLPPNPTCSFGDPLTVTHLGGGAVQVCGIAFRCNHTSRFCESVDDPLACGNDGDCASVASIGLVHCIAGSCGCADDSDCPTDNPKCYGASSTCGCADDSDCTNNSDICDTRIGVCICSDDTVCAADQTCALPGVPQ